MDRGDLITLRSFFEYIKTIALNAHNVQRHKRRLSEAVGKIQDYAECFKCLDLDKKGVIYPKVMQNYLIKHKYYLQPTAISRLYNKYSHSKQYLDYQDLLQALLPHSNYVLVSTTISNLSETNNQPSKFVYSCNKERIKSIQYFTAFIFNLEIKALTQDYLALKKVTLNSQRVGALLWRLLDRNHLNSVNYQNICENAKDVGINITQPQWLTFLYWHFHSYKLSINRSDFMKLLDVHNQMKRATSTCKIDQFKLEEQIYKRAEEERLRALRIEEAVKDKLKMVPLVSLQNYKHMAKEEHFTSQHLGQKRQLRGKVGYSRPKNLVKYVVEI